ncbi:MAG: carbohydrate ABC transporter permease [Firmicutes bacterium]|nr:carbohydrate ABC transporter permease [Bacillota bacterium]
MVLVTGIPRKIKIQSIEISLHIILMLGALGMIMPFLWMITTSLKPLNRVFAYPPEWLPRYFEWGNYLAALRGAPFERFYLNTIIIAVTVTFSQLVLCSMAAYAFARLRFHGRDILFMAVLSTMMIPGQVTLIPSFLVVKHLNWLDTYYALIVPDMVGAFGIFLLRQFLISLPVDLEDAARIDGCSRFMILWRILLPLIKPALSTLAVFNFMWSWNAFLWPLIVTNKTTMRTIQVGLSIFRSRYGIQWTYLMAGTVIATLPVLVVFLFGQKQFIRGITLTGFKG